MNIKSDSRKINKGDTFIALRGACHDGHEYILDAIKRGATHVICEEGNYEVPTTIVSDTHAYLVDYLDKTYQEELKDLKLIGMTGTNGKTTTCFLIYQALNRLEIPCAYIGTIGFYMDGKVRDLPNTTPDVLDIYEMLLEAKRKGCHYVAMEVSSHALSYERVGMLKFHYTMFSNLTEDHLDYHKTMENYAQAKQKLFLKTQEPNIAIINQDDPYYHYFTLTHNQNISYGTNDTCDYQIIDFELQQDGTRFSLKKQERIENYHMNLLGKHNIYNMTCVLILLEQLDIPYHKRRDVSASLTAPDGRMDVVSSKSGMILVDYAHTPDAVEKAIIAARELPHEHVYTLVGCGGDRDKLKRPIMGEIATNLSDFVIFTSDNPRTENPMEILNDMTVTLQKDNYITIENRKEAINKGIQMMNKNDILLVLGKGHETYQIIGTKKYDFDDKLVIKEILNKEM